MSEIGRTILIVDEEKLVCDLLSHLMTQEGLTSLVANDCDTAERMLRYESPDVLIGDLRKLGTDDLEVLRLVKTVDSDLPVILLTCHATARGAAEAMKAGAYYYMAKPFSEGELVAMVRGALNQNKRRRECRPQPAQPSWLQQIMGTSQAMKSLRSQISCVAKSNFSVMIFGETGTGKELVAKWIHQASTRSSAPFIPVDCGAIAEGLLESELFGHERGAFTDARALQRGKFEAAQGGTLFLDEISNLSQGAQAKLLRVLQERIVYRVGSSKPLNVDVRVLAASNHDLGAMAASGSFRNDLFFRLNEFSITIPPLRERREDILGLANWFLELTNQELNKRVGGFSECAVEALLTYNWPGNVRELRSTIRRAVLLADETDRDLDIHLVNDMILPCQDSAASWEERPLKEIVRNTTMAVEREVISQALRRTGGNKAKAARLLQIDYKTIHSKVKTYGISQAAGHPSAPVDPEKRAARAAGK